LMFSISGIFLIGALSLGFLISVIATSQFFATQLALLGTFLPAFLLSGFVFPVSNMPQVLQAITYIVPARHLIPILRAIFLKGAGLEAFILPTVMLVIFAFIVTALAAGKLEKRI
jgi:ABC-2 type transport system permease protein